MHTILNSDDVVPVPMNGRLRVALSEKLGVAVPDSARFMYHDNHDDAPARCTAPSESFSCGYTLFTVPGSVPGPLPETFLSACDWFTWVWCG